MKIFLVVFTLLFLLFLSACSFNKSAYNKKLYELTDEYNQVYDFDKQIREEILERKALRQEILEYRHNTPTN